MTLHHVPNTMNGDNIGMLYHGTRHLQSAISEGIVPSMNLPDDALFEHYQEPLVVFTPDPVLAARSGDVVRVDASHLELTVVEGEHGTYYVTSEAVDPDVLTNVADIHAELDLLEFMASQNA